MQLVALPLKLIQETLPGGPLPNTKTNTEIQTLELLQKMGLVGTSQIQIQTLEFLQQQKNCDW